MRNQDIPSTHLLLLTLYLATQDEVKIYFSTIPLVDCGRHHFLIGYGQCLMFECSVLLPDKIYTHIIVIQIALARLCSKVRLMFNLIGVRGGEGKRGNRPPPKKIFFGIVHYSGKNPYRSGKKLHNFQIISSGLFPDQT